MKFYRKSASILRQTHVRKCSRGYALLRSSFNDVNHAQTDAHANFHASPQPDADPNEGKDAYGTKRTAKITVVCQAALPSARRNAAKAPLELLRATACAN